MSCEKETNVFSSEAVLDALAYIILECGSYGACDNCPIYVENNDYECANYIAKIVLDADWSGYNNTKRGMIEKDMLRMFD